MIRFARESDGPDIAAIYAPAVADATSFELDPPDAAEMVRRVGYLSARLPWLVCEAAGVVAGYAYASPHRDRPAYRWCTEVSVYVRGDFQRSGIARALYTSLFAVLTLQGYRNAYAGVTLPNPASVAFHRAIGFTPLCVFHGIGYKLGGWHDVGWFERGLAPRDADPADPTPLVQLLGQGELDEAVQSGVPLIRIRGTSGGATPQLPVGI
jgi:L-amino acid N-acyltransferase YncA